MPTRSDQLHSYQFMTQRVISAFVMRETDPRQSPLRRGIGAVFGGLMIAVVVAAGFGVYGILTKVGGNEWKTAGSVVIEKETGASFVFLGGTLHPTVNLASAMLASGRPSPQVFRVASNSLGTVPRGVTVGIPGAPNSLPPAAKRVGPPWTVCSTPGTDSSGRSTTTVAVAVSVAPTGGRSLTDQGVLVTDAARDQTYLVWHGQRHRLAEARSVVPALFGAANPAPVGAAWLSALPAGVDIGPIPVQNRGDAANGVPGRKVGDVLVTQTGSGQQFYLVFPDGIAPITQLQKDVLGGTASSAPAQVELSVVNNAPKSKLLPQRTGGAQPPNATPELVVPEGADQVCAVTGDPGAPPAIRVGGSVAGLAGATPTTGASPDGAPLAGRVLVPAGRVAVVRVLSAPGAESGSYFVLTDLGIKYPVPTPPILTMLGYSPALATDVPASLANRIPTGPTLDPAAAVQPVPVNAR